MPESWPGIRYTWLTTANKNLLQTFENTTVVGGSDTFTWVHPLTSVSHTVRFMARLKYTPHRDTNASFWMVEFGLEEE